MQELDGSKRTQFKQGKSGNPGGRPKGIVNAKREAEKLLLSRKDEIIAKAIEMALSGDNTMIKAMLPFMMPKVQDTPTNELEGMKNKTIKEKTQLIQDAMEEGRLSPLEAAACLNVVEKSVNLVEVQELEERIRAIESKI